MARPVVSGGSRCDDGADFVESNQVPFLPKFSLSFLNEPVNPDEAKLFDEYSNLEERSILQHHKLAFT